MTNGLIRQVKLPVRLYKMKDVRDPAVMWPIIVK